MDIQKMIKAAIPAFVALIVFHYVRDFLPKA